MVAYVAGQETAVDPKRAGLYAAAFTSGLFVTIALVGMVCAGLGRLLGDVGPMVAGSGGCRFDLGGPAGMLGVQACSMSGSMLYRLNLRGIHGAFGLGLAIRCPFRIMHPSALSLPFWPWSPSSRNGQPAR